MRTAIAMLLFGFQLGTWFSVAMVGLAAIFGPFWANARAEKKAARVMQRVIGLYPSIPV